MKKKGDGEVFSEINVRLISEEMMVQQSTRTAATEPLFAECNYCTSDKTLSVSRG